MQNDDDEETGEWKGSDVHLALKVVMTPKN